MNFSLDDIKYAAEECQRQQSGEMSVFNMMNALAYARRENIGGNGFIHYDQIERLAFHVEPDKNFFGIRRTPVIVKGNLISHKNVEAGLKQLCSSRWHMVGDADDFYYQFQLIHPYIDGNGRTGSIIWNALRGSLDCPIAPPDMFGGG